MTPQDIDTLIETLEISPVQYRSLSPYAEGRIGLMLGEELAGIASAAGVDHDLLFDAQGLSHAPHTSLACTPQLQEFINDKMIYPVGPRCEPVGQNYVMELSGDRLFVRYQSIIGSRQLCLLTPEQRQRLAQRATQLLAQRHAQEMSERRASRPCAQPSTLTSTQTAADPAEPTASGGPAAHPIEAAPARRLELVASKPLPARLDSTDPELAEQLRSLTLDGTVMRLPAHQLSRYADIRKIMLAAGGKYKKSTFVFADVATAEAALNGALSGKSVNLKKDTQFFATPKEVGDLALAALGGLQGCRVLEPSAGRGALADLARQAGAHEVVTVEMWDVNAQALRDAGYDPIEEDFLAVTPERTGLFDAVIMNPPFTKGQDMEHVRHAMSFLRPDGRLTSVMATGFQYRSDKKSKTFNELVQIAEAEVEQVPAGAFKESGTSIPTVIVSFDMEVLLERLAESGRDASEFGIDLSRQIDEQSRRNQRLRHAG